MYTLARTLVLLSSFIPALVCAQGSTHFVVALTQIDPSVVEGADAYRKAVLAADAAAVAVMFRDDAVLMPSNRPLVRGRAVIEQFYSEWFKGPAKVSAFTFTHIESPVVGDIAYDVGTYQQTLSIGPDASVNDSGKYTVILKRSSTEWKIAYLIFNSDFPAKMPPAVSNNR